MLIVRLTGKLWQEMAQSTKEGNAREAVSMPPLIRKTDGRATSRLTQALSASITEIMGGSLFYLRLMEPIVRVLIE